ncbi:hypothetical protein HPB47_026630 [Ixodes persulcatus]|uniref:Uncharacterized protein n=1 Tax=Ixodes persulcatus TaxID=34615 RepID=A0AC60PYS2_IXOPE|nr:hypothetical protein HPB47_026630 [Ixodes persulcatus]
MKVFAAALLVALSAQLAAAGRLGEVDKSMSAWVKQLPAKGGLTKDGKQSVLGAKYDLLFKKIEDPELDDYFHLVQAKVLKLFGSVYHLHGTALHSPAPAFPRSWGSVGGPNIEEDDGGLQIPHWDHVNVDVSSKVFVSADDHLATCELRTLQDIIPEATSTTVEDDDDDEDDDTHGLGDHCGDRCAANSWSGWTEHSGKFAKGESVGKSGRPQRFQGPACPPGLGTEDATVCEALPQAPQNSEDPKHAPPVYTSMVVRTPTRARSFRGRTGLPDDALPTESLMPEDNTVTNRGPPGLLDVPDVALSLASHMSEDATVTTRGPPGVLSNTPQDVSADVVGPQNPPTGILTTHTPQTIRKFIIKHWPGSSNTGTSRTTEWAAGFIMVMTALQTWACAHLISASFRSACSELVCASPLGHSPQRNIMECVEDELEGDIRDVEQWKRVVGALFLVRAQRLSDERQLADAHARYSSDIDQQLQAIAFTIAALMTDNLRVISRERWTFQRNERWFEDTLPHLGEFHFKQAFCVSPTTFGFLMESCRCLLAVAGRRAGAKAGN